MLSAKENLAGSERGFKGGVMQIHKRSLAKIALTVKGFVARRAWILWGLA
jgi:hypothetical protein